ncbi:ATP-binding protein [Dactylosporangium sp. CA-233914]|uniref:ATP-binding protein n=1 Tax=Dactylosporangium sp. CA-233914 TaxID=3239934 RepID=UPI003D8DFCF7
MCDGRLVIEVADTGRGIAAADLPKVFDRSRSRISGGSWLGLSIARAHGGDLTVSSEPGHGARLTAGIPA